jgi:hypothetical protein
MTDQYNRIAFKKALEKSLEFLGEPSKKSLLLYLEKDFNISFAQNATPRIEDLEAALKSILGRSAYIITDEIYKNLGVSDPRAARKRLVASRQSKASA